MTRPLVVVALLACFACNALVGYGDLEKVAGDSTSSSSGTGGGGGGGDDDDGDPRPGTSSNGDPGTSGGTGGPGDSGTLRRCDPSQPFGAPVPVAAFDGHKARLTTDELEAFWVGPSNSLRHAKRGSRDAPWETPETIVLSPKFLLLNSVSRNGNRIYYTPSNGEFTTRFVTRSDRNSSWGNGIETNEPNQSDNVFYADGDDVAFLDFPKNTSSNENNLFSVPVVGGLLNGTLTPVPNVDQAGVSDWNPVINASLTNLYFLRGDEPNAKVFVARRSKKDGTFGAPVEEPALAGDDGDAPTWVSDDDCIIYLTRFGKTSMAVRAP